jgi:hypothetical protein
MLSAMTGKTVLPEPDVGREVDHLADSVARLAELIVNQYAAMEDQLRLMTILERRIGSLEENVSCLQGRSLRVVERKN